MILVTGASGRLGTHLVEELASQEEEVRVLVRDKPVNAGNVEIVKGDILDVQSLSKALDGVDTVYHLAAALNYDSVPKEALYNVNVLGTKNLLDCFNGSRFIYQSTTAVYGDKMKENPASETTQCNPSSYYGKTKMLAEKLVLGKKGIILRCPIIYGKGFDTGFDYVLSQIQNGKMRIIGNGNNRIQWVHISDLIEALVLAKNKGIAGETYLVCGSDIKTQKELLGIIAKQLNVETPQKSVPELLASLMALYKGFTYKMKGMKPKITKSQISTVASDRTFDISKARKELGFDPKIDYQRGANEIAAQYLARKSLA